MASTYLTKTFGSAGNRKTWTWSGWVKRNTNASGFHALFEAGRGTNPFFVFSFYEDGINVANTAGVSADWNSTRKFRDTNGFYHVMLVVDTTSATSTMNGSSTDRMRVYVNNEQVVLSGGSVPSQNADLQVNQAIQHNIGGYNGISNMFDGIMTHVHFIDGTAYSPSDFGETDSTTGIWKPKTAPSVTYGTNGFFLKFENSGSMGTDSSGNSNNWTVNGTITQTIDTPSNVFCTLNPLSTDSGVTLSNGNTESDYDATVGNAKGTLGFSKGKYYWEVKIATSASSYPMLGIGSLDEAQMQQPTGGSYPGGFTNSYGAYGNGNVYANNSNTGSQSFTWTTNDIIGIAVDLDSATKTIKWFKNGSEIASYNITTAVPFAPMDYNGGEGAVNLQYNFGNGYFGTTAVSSAGTNSGIGTFEYDVPSGYKALCTKNINAQEYS